MPDSASKPLTAAKPLTTQKIVAVLKKAGFDVGHWWKGRVTHRRTRGAEIRKAYTGGAVAWVEYFGGEHCRKTDEERRDMLRQYEAALRAAGIDAAIGVMFTSEVVLCRGYLSSQEGGATP